MANNISNTQKFVIGAAGIVVISAVFVTGIVALGIGLIALPIYSAFRKRQVTKSPQAPNELKDTAIEAEFKRID